MPAVNLAIAAAVSPMMLRAKGSSRSCPGLPLGGFQPGPECHQPGMLGPQGRDVRRIGSAAVHPLILPG